MAGSDYYDTLELPRTAEAGAIKTAYRRLARLRHPDKNPGDPNATAVFQKLNTAYEILSDPQKRKLYDLQHDRAKTPGYAQSDAHRSRHGHETRGGRASSSPKPDQFTETDEMRKHRQRRQELENLLQTLHMRETVIKRELNSARAKLKERTDLLDRLQTEALQDERDEASRRGWLGFLWQLTPEEQEERDRIATARRTGMLVVQARIENSKSEVERNRELLDKLRPSIQQALRQKAAVDEQYDRAYRTEEHHKREEAHRRSAQARWENRQREHAAREAEAQRRREESARAAEARREAQDQAARARREAHADAAWARRETASPARTLWEVFEEVQISFGTSEGYSRSSRERQGARNHGKAHNGRPPWDPRNQPPRCRHRTWWDQIEGTSTCQRCQERTTRLAFQCSECDLIACANCRMQLRNGA